MGGVFYVLAILIAVLIVGVLVIGAIASWVLIQREDYISPDDDKCLVPLLTSVENTALLKEYCMKELECKHKITEKRFVGYLFTEELYAVFCKDCKKQIDKPKT